MHASETAFTSLADFLRAHPTEPFGERACAPARDGEAQPVEAVSASAVEPITAGEPAGVDAVRGVSALPATAAAAEIGAAGGEFAAALREARLFRAALADAADVLAGKLADALARAVLARELQLARADIAALAQRLCAEFAADEPLRLRVAPSDAGFDCALPVSADPQLAPGDAILECRSGTIDARLSARLAHVLAEIAS